MMKTLLTFFFLLISVGLQATHIVGGGFSLHHESQNEYRLKLLIYFDDINGSPQAQDQFLTCYIFSKRTNTLVQSLYMPLVENSEFVPYTNPPCANTSGVRTRIMKYEAGLTLDPSVYFLPDGYYVVWERCCRNGLITNILSPGATGQVFYMEFPTPAIGGQPFINNSPQFLPIKADYPCLQEPFKLAFGAVDPDGDSLVYSMTKPLRGNSTSQAANNVPPTPGPYSTVTFLAGFDEFNAITGNPSLGINPVTGELSCRPDQTGLFVFAVKCEEYRDGRKIGEVRREMQILVKDCVPNSPPTVRILDSKTGTFVAENDTLFIDVTNKRVCEKIIVKDPQTDQSIRFQVRTLESSVPTSLLKDTIAFFSGLDSLVIPFCLEPCLVTPQDQAWKIQFHASDDGCSFSKSDSITIFIVARLRLDSIQKPKLVTTIPMADTLFIEQTNPVEIPFRATQSQNAKLTVSSSFMDNNGNPQTAQGLILPSGFGTGLVNTRFFWPEICLVPPHQPLELTIVAESDYCLQTRDDTLIKYLRIQPKNLEIDIMANSSFGPVIETRVGEEVNIPIVGTLSENRLVQLSAKGSLKNVSGFQFPQINGNGEARSVFKFLTDCSTPAGTYPVTFLATGQFCTTNYVDSLNYRVVVLPQSDSLEKVPNLITANGDGLNDGLILSEIYKAGPCAYTFDFVEIYNRWGNQVFYSTNPDFEWKPGSGMDGVFFYSLHFKEETFTSWVAVVKGF